MTSEKETDEAAFWGVSRRQFIVVFGAGAVAIAAAGTYGVATSGVDPGAGPMAGAADKLQVTRAVRGPPKLQRRRTRWRGAPRSRPPASPTVTQMATAATVIQRRPQAIRNLETRRGATSSCWK